jgi:hypothetical protein
MAECQRPIAHSGATPERNLSFRSTSSRNSPTRNHIVAHDDTSEISEIAVATGWRIQHAGQQWRRCVPPELSAVGW